jgi:hypothetical protein
VSEPRPLGLRVLPSGVFRGTWRAVFSCLVEAGATPREGVLGYLATWLAGARVHSRLASC